jgi:hypothetical protein
MGLRWLRGPTANNTGVGDGTNDYARVGKDFYLFCFYYLRRILGWTYVDEQTAGSWVFDTAHSQTNTDGVLTNTDYTFTSAGATFTAADIGRFVVIVDAVNEENCGIFEILTQPSSTQLTIDWYTTGGTFPTAATGLTYYILDGDTAGDPNPNDYFVLESGHSTNPCTIKFSITPGSTQNFNQGLIMEVAAEAGAWDNIGHAWNSGVALMSHQGKLARGPWNLSHGRMFAVGDTDGSFFHIWNHHNAATGNKQGGGIAVVNALESSPTPDPKELVGWFGNGSGAGDNANWNRNYNAFDAMGVIRYWSENLGKSTESTWLGWYDGTGVIEAMRHTFANPNSRTGKRDGLPIWTNKDHARTPDQLWAPWGEIPTSKMLLASVNAIGEHVAFDSNNYFHIRDGVVVPWPGIPFA